MARWIVASGLSTRRPAGVGFREVSVVEIKEVLLQAAVYCGITLGPRGGVVVASRATGLARGTIERGLKDLVQPRHVAQQR